MLSAAFSERFVLCLLVNVLPPKYYSNIDDNNYNKNLYLQLQVVKSPDLTRILNYDLLVMNPTRYHMN